MSLDLLRERFGYSVKKEADNKEKINEKLNDKFNSDGIENLKSFKAQHQGELEEKERIIENLEIETSELANQVLTLEREKSTIIEELNNSKWMENTVASKTKKIYEDKIRTMSIVDSSKLIPTLIEVSRKKQGNELLNWGKWLEISENKYLFQINEDMAKKVFQDTTALIKRYISNINLPTQRRELIEAGRTSRTRGGDATTTRTIYGLSFDGLTQSVNTTFGGSNAVATDRTYSFWMKSDVTTLSTQGVFGYGSSKREAFSLNISQASMGKPKFAFATHMYNIFMTEDHEEQDGGSTGDADSGASDATAHIEAQDDGQWHHWMLFSDVSNPENAKLYIDGVEQDTAKFANTGTLNTQQDSLTIGAVDSSATNNEHFEGYLTNFAVFTGDVTSNAVAHYNSGIPNKDLSDETGLVGYWKMDENGGTNVADSIGGNDGTIVNGAEWITVMEV